MSQKKLEWFWEPWIPCGLLSIIVGQSGSGKSSLSAFLMSRARRSILFAGDEEDPELMVLPRLVLHGGRVNDVLSIEDGDWCMPRAEDRLIDLVRSWRAELVILDPIDSYKEDGISEDNGDAVRRFLESYKRIGQRTGAAIVGIRHPGKDPTNVMPGSRNWRNVPRSVVELVSDEGEGRQRIIRPYKDSLGQDADSRYFTLKGERGKARLFELGDPVARDEARVIKTVADPVERAEIERCKLFLLEVLTDQWMDCRDVYKMAEDQKLNPRTLRLAHGLVGAEIWRHGSGKNHKCEWAKGGTSRPLPE